MKNTNDDFCPLCGTRLAATPIPKSVTPLENLCLSRHVRNRLVRAGISTVEKLLQHTPNDILRMRGVGPVFLREIVDKLDNMGLQFAHEHFGYKQRVVIAKVSAH